MIEWTGGEPLDPIRPAWACQLGWYPGRRRAFWHRLWFDHTHHQCIEDWANHTSDHVCHCGARLSPEVLP